MEQLFLGDLTGFTNEQVRSHIVDAYQISDADLARFDVLVAYESVGAYGCDSSAWLLLKERNTHKLFENHASHCSCYGFEGQFNPEETAVDYLFSEHFNFSTGGYGDSADFGRARDFIIQNIDGWHAVDMDKDAVI